MRHVFACAVLLVLPSLARAVAPTPAEMELKRRWVAAKLGGAAPPASTQPALAVIENHDAVQKNARGGKPLRLGDRTFTRGLYCHASSRVVVRNIPASAKTF